MAFEVNLHSLIHCWLPIDHMFATLTSSSVAAHFDTVLWLSSRQAAWRSYDNRVRTRYVHGLHSRCHDPGQTCLDEFHFSDLDIRGFFPGSEF